MVLNQNVNDMENKNVFIEEASGDGPRYLHIPKSSILYLRAKVGCLDNDPFEIVLVNGEVFKKEEGFRGFLKWLDE